MIRPIKLYGEAVLHRPAPPVDALTPEIAVLIDDMIETMYAAPGVGLAAPQIGMDLRIFVIDVSSGRNAADLVVMINPEMVAVEGVQSREEGCLSLPGFEALVPRPERAVMRGLDRDGRAREVEGSGLTARAFQHELDHLNGRLFVDRLRGLKREQIVRRVRKLRRTGKW